MSIFIVRHVGKDCYLYTMRYVGFVSDKLHFLDEILKESTNSIGEFLKIINIHTKEKEKSIRRKKFKQMVINFVGFLLWIVDSRRKN